MSLILDKITKRFDDKLLFENFSFTFPDTGIFAICGESGIGKTTLLRIIAGLDKKYKGAILGGGIKNCSFAFQEYRLFKNLKAWENVAYAVFKKPCNDDIASSLSLLSELGITNDNAQLYPDELSGGMKQRVSFARAVMKASPVLILDEPTKELDIDTKSSLLRIIQREGQKRLVLIVTHDLSDIEFLGAEIVNF